jgi:ADP-ribose pyrophosphatase YjhB (NUDIX family)
MKEETAMEAPHHVKLVVDVAVVDGSSVLMTRYRDPGAYDGQRGLFLPNDLLLDREDPEDAAARILRDQRGIDGSSPEFGFAESFTGRNRTCHLVLHYVVQCDGGPN